MARGGYRPGAGRKPRAPKATRGAPLAAPTESTPVAEPAEARIERTPLEHMLAVMNDTTADAGRRDRMAVAAAPFVHPRAGEAKKGKKEQRAEAAQAMASGKYAPPPPPPGQATH